MVTGLFYADWLCKVPIGPLVPSAIEEGEFDSFLDLVEVCPHILFVEDNVTVL